MDAPKYTELALDETGGFIMPIASDLFALFAIVREPGSGIYDKIVWLVKPK